MALRVFTRYSADKGDFKHIVRSSSAQDRAILSNFFTGVLGTDEGRGAFSAVERFISQISEGQDLPAFDAENIFDLSTHLYQAVQVTDQYQQRNQLYCVNEQELQEAQRLQDAARCAAASLI